ncbi:fructosamine kinase family protein [Salibacterium aidingense]|uniref:fructosamine kinase family protein n=1 Tax=Salibacterium aidingense TaxID=384933 RepID=UPI000425AC18|nr:fructosamine kinase family protein [Salibacterium aidingense]
MNENLTMALRQAGIQEEVKNIQQVSGGSISKAFMVDTGRASYFIKWHEEAPTDFFRQEALGLEFLAEAEALSVPYVYAWDKKFIVMEPVNGRSAFGTEEELGRGMAVLHSTKGTVFGLEEDNFIGELPQINGWEESWLPFLREKRLRPQIDLARSLGRLPESRAKRAYRLLERLDKWIPDHHQPVKLHGDLWGGNWLPGRDGQPYFIDPAVWYGDHEFELAFTYLFGGFSETVYQAYQEHKQIDSLFEERKPLYQLYYLLVHLNIFGESYGSPVDRILKKYTE